jgi:phosphoribosylamine--glycine ligase
VVKADGLAAGKGVLICETLAQAYQAVDDILDKQIFGAAGSSLVIEEYLEGEELSLMAFADGRTAVPMVAAQDHKRIFDGDQGPNTGGMGAYAPAPAGTEALVEKVRREILQPTVDAMRAEGRTFQGVLYAGLMLTKKGPMALEFNARFGDPETEAVLPLLETDLLEIMEACVAGRLAETAIRWRDASCVTVILASAGYPAGSRSGDVIAGLDRVPEGTMVFHCGTAFNGQGQVVTAGGRVLAATACAPSLAAAVAAVYRGADVLSFAGAQYRRDIARRALG